MQTPLTFLSSVPWTTPMPTLALSTVTTHDHPWPVSNVDDGHHTPERVHHPQPPATTTMCLLFPASSGDDDGPSTPAISDDDDQLPTSGNDYDVAMTPSIPSFARSAPGTAYRIAANPASKFLLFLFFTTPALTRTALTPQPATATAAPPAPA